MRRLTRFPIREPPLFAIECRLLPRRLRAATLERCSAGQERRPHPAREPTNTTFDGFWGVDIRSFESIYSGNSARRRLGASARLRSSSLIFGDQASDPKSEVRRLRRLSGSPEGGTAMVPGCLTGESEERETWTAESLRAAILASKLVLERGRFRRDPAGRDFGGRRFWSTPNFVLR